MTYQPIVPFGGYVGWRFLQRTIETQQQAFAKSAPVQRDTDYFRDNIGKIKSADELVGDRRLLSVALGAFGLGDDIKNKFFIKRVLEDGITSADALANKLSDKRYRALSQAFGLGAGSVVQTGRSSFSETIIAKYEQQQFALAVGEQNPDMRLALNISESLNEITSLNQTQNGQWFSMMGNPPLRSVFENALGLPKSIGLLDIDLQLKAFKERSISAFGTDDLSRFSEPKMQEDLIRLFLVRSESQSSNTLQAGSIALTLLQGLSPVGQ